MNEIENNAATEKKPVKKSWKKTKRVFLILLALVVLCAGVYCYREKPAKLAQTTDPDGADFKKGEIVDYHFLYNAAQDEALSPPEENGWRLILQALGPRALNQKRLVTGAVKQRVKFTDREWEAVQAGAVHHTFLKELLRNADSKEVKQLAMPREKQTLSPARASIIKQRLDNGYTQREIASMLDIPLSQVEQVSKESR